MEKLFEISPSETLLKEISLTNGNLILDNEEYRRPVKVKKNDHVLEEAYTVLSLDGGRCKMKEVSWKEAKMGVIYEYDRESRPKNRHVFGRVDINSKDFGKLASYHYKNYKDYSKSRPLIFLSDGMPYNWEIKNQHFPGAIEVLDFYHAAEHLANAVKIVYGEYTKDFYKNFENLKKALHEGKKDYVLKWFQKTKNQNDDYKKEEKYFIKNYNRIDYGRYRSLNIPIGSGVMESSIKQTVNQRLKSSEKTWTHQGANTILSIKLLVENKVWDDFILKKAA